MGSLLSDATECGKVTFNISDNSAYTRGTPLIHISGGQIERSSSGSGNNYRIEQIIVTYNDGIVDYQTLLAQQHINWTATLDQTITASDSSGVKSISFSMGIRCTSTSSEYEQSYKIPWSCFTWLPTGQQFTYIPGT